MIYSFANISSSIFTLNARNLFKTFLAIPVGTNSIKIVNVYDSKSVLIPTTLVSEIEVEGITYNSAIDLINAIYAVIFSKSTSGSLDSSQIEANRLAIINLQGSQTNSNHNHDSRYYKKLQVDTLIANIQNASNGAVKGEVDGSDIKFRSSDNTVLFSINAKSFLSQGTNVIFENGVLTLKNSFGETLSTANIEAKETYYDKFKYSIGIENDLSDLILTEKFEIVKTNDNSIYFVSSINNDENLESSSIFVNSINTFFKIGIATILNTNFKASKITLDTSNLVESLLYNFNVWKTSVVNKQEFDSAISALQGSNILQGNWNANTNIPDITGATKTGNYWIVDTNGTTDLGGFIEWKVNDWAIKTATGWAKVDNTDSVISVAGKKGVISLSISDVNGLAISLGNRLRVDISNQNLTAQQKLNASKNIGASTTIIKGAIVETAGKTDWQNFELNDVFTFNDKANSTYYKGVIKDITAILPNDINTSKISLISDNIY